MILGYFLFAKVTMYPNENYHEMKPWHTFVHWDNLPRLTVYILPPVLFDASSIT